MKTIAFFHPDIQKSTTKLEEVIGEFKYKEVKRVRRFSGGMMVEAELTNGDRYIAVQAFGDLGRGLRLDEAHVSKETEVEYILKVVAPMLKEQSGIQYF